LPTVNKVAIQAHKKDTPIFATGITIYRKFIQVGFYYWNTVLRQIKGDQDNEMDF